MKCYCVARNKPIRHEKTKQRTAVVIYLSLVCGFEVCSHVLNFIVIGHYTISVLNIFRCSRFSEFDSGIIIFHS